MNNLPRRAAALLVLVLASLGGCCVLPFDGPGRHGHGHGHYEGRGGHGR